MTRLSRAVARLTYGVGIALLVSAFVSEDGSAVGWVTLVCGLTLTAVGAWQMEDTTDE